MRRKPLYSSTKLWGRLSCHYGVIAFKPKERSRRSFPLQCMLKRRLLRVALVVRAILDDEILERLTEVMPQRKRRLLASLFRACVLGGRNNGMPMGLRTAAVCAGDNREVAQIPAKEMTLHATASYALNEEESWRPERGRLNAGWRHRWRVAGADIYPYWRPY